MMMRKGSPDLPIRPLWLVACAALLAGCSQFPELDDTVSGAARKAAYPDLVPVEVLRAGLPAQQITEDSSPALEARVDRLRARAARLRGTVIDAPTRQALRRKIVIEG
ncbi:MAG: hypothetical protein NXH84_06495 [Rhodobacteraceae bacterium]|jgi:type IV pilus biogenesis protein CpaD/CtpE|nr:hypothetical protein [Paracoccaceae bacterium]